MPPRLDLFAAAPALAKAWYALSTQVEKAGLEPDLLELVKIRSSQINGCANCLNMHNAHARKLGEQQKRLDVLSAWREAPWFSERERAALAWTEHLTDIAGKRAPDAVYQALAAQFTPAEQAQLTLMINVINGWNRIAIGFDMFDESLAA
ncbi:carboxymuconolactone decarboxylase family protein [Hephaestia sp. GCM10023244]|uniref:carboxymuconolactone decarboxylase family protein n=1 Tax=unclassified Hephaestia TaxID=2631281 RepID=UPI00207765A2|nr:carboxymuconolactone decarboxylase family protein [Hephaestia sp. MAHUQ-44]MCM8732137.1 carboxymuconolactone decarboxylase family protein [Hephaestia sp. MAHUQ-44]